MDIRARLEALAAAPKTHRVTTHYACGKTRTFDAHSEAAANTHAITESRNVDRDLIDRVTGATVRKVRVEVAPIH